MALEVPPPEVLPPSAASSRVASSVISLVLLVVSVGFATAGQVTLKAGMERVGRIGTSQVRDAGATVRKALKVPLLWLGLFLFGVSAIFWLVVLSRVPLSLAYPFVGLSYIVVVALGRFLFNEDVPPAHWAGVLIIAIGIALIGLTSRTATGA